jgi:CheY-like chemotaxis protein
VKSRFMSEPTATAAPILVVEDDADVRRYAVAVLEQAGYRVLVAEDGVAAFFELERSPDIDLLFTDIKMPRIDGLMLADMAKLRHPKLRILYATGFADETGRQPGYRYGDVLSKPYQPAQLESAVRRALEGSTVPMRSRPP